MKTARQQWLTADSDDRFRYDTAIRRVSDDLQVSISEAMADYKGRLIYRPLHKRDLKLFRKYLATEFEEAGYSVRDIKFLWLFPVAVEIGWTWLIP